MMTQADLLAIVPNKDVLRNVVEIASKLRWSLWANGGVRLLSRWIALSSNLLK